MTFLSLAPMILAVVAQATTSTSPASSPDACHDIDRLAWLAGGWRGEQNGVEMEEHWTAVRGASLLGLHRDVLDGRTVSFEFMRIQETTDGLVYRAQPGGRPAVTFSCVEHSSERIVFENKAHDFPQRVLYWKAEGRLKARIEGMTGGELKSMEWSWGLEP
jgi:hypothetical protein